MASTACETFSMTENCHALFGQGRSLVPVGRLIAVFGPELLSADGAGFLPSPCS